MFIPAPATMRVGDVMECFSQNDKALFVRADFLERGDVQVLDTTDVEYDVSNNMLRLDEVLVRVR